jgi:hypothetical protein
LNTEVHLYLNGIRISSSRMANLPAEGARVNIIAKGTAFSCVVKDVTWFIPDGSEPYVHIQLESS